MTDNQRKQIKKLRADDCGYMKISYMYIHAPLYCKKKFTAYENSSRKYCSHEYCINDRFGGE